MVLAFRGGSGAEVMGRDGGGGKAVSSSSLSKENVEDAAVPRAVEDAVASIGLNKRMISSLVKGCAANWPARSEERCTPIGAPDGTSE